MIRLDLERDPHWLNLGHGVRLHVRPCTTAPMMGPRAEVQRAVTSSAGDSEAAGVRTAALIKALARLAVLDWDGISDAAGSVALVTPDSVDALMDLWPIASAFENAYLGPALLLDAEKNAEGSRRMHFGGGPEYRGGRNQDPGRSSSTESPTDA